MTPLILGYEVYPIHNFYGMPQGHILSPYILCNWAYLAKAIYYPLTAAVMAAFPSKIFQVSSCWGTFPVR